MNSFVELKKVERLYSDDRVFIEKFFFNFWILFAYNYHKRFEIRLILLSKHELEPWEILFRVILWV